jgi:hypothetical protein
MATKEMSQNERQGGFTGLTVSGEGAAAMELCPRSKVEKGRGEGVGWFIGARERGARGGDPWCERRSVTNKNEHMY